MLQQPKQKIGKRGSGKELVSERRKMDNVSTGLLGIGRLNKALDACPFELPLDSVESKESGSSDSQETSADTEGEASYETGRPTELRRKLVRWGVNREQPTMYMRLGEFEMGNNSLDINNSGQGVDMQNLPSIAEQMERQRTWMTIYFRYRVNWYEAKPTLAKMPRETAYKSANLPLWTNYLKVQLHRKTIFLNAIRAFRNRMQCATSGVRFTMNSFYREVDRKTYSDSKEGPEPKPLPYFKTPDDMPDIKTMVVAQMNVFVSNSSSFFDMFWDESLKEGEAPSPAAN